MAKKEASQKTFDRLALAVGKYVEESGGKAVVVGGIRIAQRDKFRFTIEIDFMGNFRATNHHYKLKNKSG